MSLENLICCNDAWRCTEKILLILAESHDSVKLDVDAAAKLYGSHQVISFKYDIVVIL